MARYSAETLNLNAPEAADGQDGGENDIGGIGSVIVNSVTSLAASSARRFRRRAASNSEVPASHAMMQRADVYSIPFFLMWPWIVVIFINVGAWGGAPTPPPNWYMASYYLTVIFQPLQDFFNLPIYTQTKETSVRRFREWHLFWPQAIARAFFKTSGLEWRGGNGGGWKRRGTPPSADEENAEVVGPGEKSTGGAAEEDRVDVRESNGYSGEGHCPFEDILHAPAKRRIWRSLVLTTNRGN